MKLLWRSVRLPVAEAGVSEAWFRAWTEKKMGGLGRGGQVGSRVREGDRAGEEEVEMVVRKATQDVLAGGSGRRTTVVGERSQGAVVGSGNRGAVNLKGPPVTATLNSIFSV